MSAPTRFYGKSLEIYRERKVGVTAWPEYPIYRAMINRCEYPNDSHFKHYGGRGIKVCDEWRKSFVLFINDVGPRPSKEYSIDRINNNLHYAPGNVKWSTALEQARNKQNSSTATAYGKTMPLREWAAISGVRYKTLWARLQYGWPVELAVTKPTRFIGDRIEVLTSNYTRDGQTKTVKEWGASAGIKYYTLSERLKRGWTVEAAITKPVATRHGRRPGPKPKITTHGATA